MKYLVRLIYFASLMVSAYGSDQNNEIPVLHNYSRIRQLEEKLDKKQADMSIPDQFEKTCHDCCLGKSKMASKQFCDKFFPKSWNNQDCPCYEQE